MRPAQIPLLALLLLQPGAALGQPAEAVPPRVTRYAEQLWTRLIDTVDVEVLLRPSCKETATLVRRSLAEDGGTDDFFISADLIVQLSDREFCNALIEWTTLQFQILLAVLSRQPIDGSVTDNDMEALYLAALRGFFPGQRLRISQDEAWLMDAFNNPFMAGLKTRKDIARLHQRMKGFRGLKAQGVNWKTPALRAFEEQFARDFPVDSRVTRNDHGQYQQSRYGWWILIDDTGKQPKVLLFVPFSQ